MFLYDNTLAFPNGVAPGFDPTHVAARIPRASVVAVEGGVLELTTGKVSSVTGVTGDVIRGSIGRARDYSVSLNGANGDNISGLPAVSDTTFTMAAIITMGAGGQGTAFFGSAFNTNVGAYVGCSSSQVVNLGVPGNTSANSTITLSTSNNTPYFVGMTVNGTTNATFVVLNLRTGQLQTSSVTPTQGMKGASTGTYQVGNLNSTTQSFRGTVAAGMYSGTYIGLQGLLEWAQDPWAFWYPSKNYSVPDFDVGTVVVIPNSKGASLLMMGV